MPVAFIGDVHLGRPKRFGGPVRCGINERGRMVLDVLERAIKAAVEAGATHIVILGDIFDTMLPEPQLVAEVRDLLHDLGTGTSTSITFVLLKGNHDSESDVPGDNAVAMLREHYVHVVEEPAYIETPDADLVCMPFRNGPILDWLPDALSGMLGARYYDKPRALCLHAGIRTPDMAAWLQSPGAIEATKLQELMEQHDIQFAFAGDYHERKKVGDMYQVGAICPTGFNNPGVTQYGMVAVLAQGKVLTTQIPGPRFIKVGVDEDLEEAVAGLPKGNTYFVEATVPADRFVEAKMVLSTLKESGVIKDGTVLPDATKAKASAKRAAAAAKQTSELPEAVTAYVNKLTIAPTVSKADVVDRAIRYLGT